MDIIIYISSMTPTMMPTLIHNRELAEQKPVGRWARTRKYETPRTMKTIGNCASFCAAYGRNGSWPKCAVTVLVGGGGAI